MHTINELLRNFGGVGLHDYRFNRHGGAVGFTWEADLYCFTCTRERFGEPVDPVSPWLDVADAEGNPVGAVFPFDEFDYAPHCGGCGTPIDAVALEEDDPLKGGDEP